jgi:hypothetical protein
MPVRKRALILAMIGPLVQAVGILWEAVHIALHHWSAPLTARHILFEPAVLLTIVGLLIALVCVPVALAVAQATEEEVQIPVYAPEGGVGQEAMEGADSGRQRAH